MSFFQPTPNPQLFVAPASDADPGFVAVLLPEGVTPGGGPGRGRGRGNRRSSAGGEGISLDDALSDKKLDASFVFSASTPDLGDAKRAAAFVTMIREQVLAPLSAKRAFIWLSEVDPQNFTRADAHVLGLAKPGSQTRDPDVELPFTADFRVHLHQGLKTSLAGTVLEFSTDEDDKLYLVGDRAPESTVLHRARLPFTGQNRGCLQLDTFLTRTSVADRLAWGLQILVPGTASGDAVAPAVAGWLPFARSDAPADQVEAKIGFTLSLDPTDPANAILPMRSFLGFSGANEDQAETRLTSNYRCRSGSTVELIPVGAEAAAGDAELRPARLVLNEASTPADEPAALPDFHFAPAGDYVMALATPTAEPADEELLCGLSGSETVSFQPRDTKAGQAGDRLRFVSRRPAYVSAWPFETADPLAAPVDPHAAALDADYLSSWAILRRDPALVETHGAPRYVSQPAGSNLFGRDALIYEHSGDGPDQRALLGFSAVGYALPQKVDELYVPLYPYAGFEAGAGARSMDADTLAKLERRVLAPQRRAAIAACDPTPVDDSGEQPAAAGTNMLGMLGAGVSPEPGPRLTTPAGLLAEQRSKGDPRWASLLLGKNQRRLEFINASSELQAAFLTSDLFLVAANPYPLEDAQAQPAAEFHSAIDIDTWTFQAAVGHNAAWGDYRNVMLVKGRRGKLVDMVGNPAIWTERQRFAAPSLPKPDGSLGPADPGQLTMLSRWLQDYFAAAEEQTSPYFDRFKRVLHDENWTGILFLRVDIAELPDDLAGITAGLDRDRFFLHHLGVEISPIAGTRLELDEPSSMFGLIYYTDPAFNPKAPEQAVPSSSASPYDFRVLTLQLLFENTSVRDFYSVAQLTLGELFGATPTHMGAGGNPYNALMLRGSYQNQGGKPSYRLASVGTNDFFMPGAPLNKVEVSAAAMSTRDPGSPAEGGGTQVVSWYGMDGFLDFSIPDDSHDPPRPVDLWSFGAPAANPDRRRQGLRYSGLGLRQVLITRDNGDKEVRFSFVADELHFDLATSTPRLGSLFSSFALELRGLVQGTVDKGPSAYLPVISDVPSAGVDGQPWYGLRFRLDLGTPGALAGKVGLNAELILAWAPTPLGEKAPSRDPIFVGIQLPGTNGDAKLFSLQNILKLSIGDIVLSYDHERKAFVMLMTEIALKVFGLLDIPPGGSTAFYLFGDPKAGGDPSGLAWYAVYAKPPEQAQA